jgi:hypothetical protein
LVRTGNAMVLHMSHQTKLTDLIVIQVMLMIQVVNPPGLREQETKGKQSQMVSCHIFPNDNQVC